jgi:hypothetical protein
VNKRRKHFKKIIRDKTKDKNEKLKMSYKMGETISKDNTKYRVVSINWLGQPDLEQLSEENLLTKNEGVDQVEIQDIEGNAMLIEKKQDTRHKILGHAQTEKYKRQIFLEIQH